MAFRSRKRTSTGEFVNDGDQPKRMKTETTNNNAAPDSPRIDSNGDPYWEISRMRRVTISTFRGKTMVNIREYYEKDGQELPGKKGISMPMDQYAAFVNLLPGIEAVLRENGQSVPRPNYDDTIGQSDGCDDEDQGEAGSDPENPTSPKNDEAATSNGEEEEE
ncbi:transcriptional coactivator p15/PC4 family protein [Aspergillus chevalieri]|uniref:Transcriptional coactivator p15 (PC4) C-terminal domain-containing protein n=1 Tax=Aspergillus chevalieri TaxID=182096 RepID=A0A7R7ZPU8_ASPCH|nr:uncharacterized protein ACHE_50289S [Aspergillus chevalieri]BCR89091.1 hypothetical protein ACHE_50289S [Aspergillus chevalieri]